MSLAWPKTLDVHLGRGYFLLRSHKQAVQAHQYPATLPLGRSFAILSDLLKQARRHHSTASRTRRLQDRLRVTLSAALCPPITHPVPTGIKSLDELQAIACAAAARQLDCDADTLVCALQPFTPGLAAALQRDLMDGLHRLADENGLKLTSVQPLWSLVTACRAARKKRCTGIQLREPDALTTISQNLTAPLFSVLSTDVMDTQVSHDASDNSLPGTLRLELTLQPQKSVANAPKRWPTHWRPS